MLQNNILNVSKIYKIDIHQHLFVLMYSGLPDASDNETNATSPTSKTIEIAQQDVSAGREWIFKLILFN